MADKKIFGCFGCRRSDPLYKWNHDNRMMVQCPIYGEIPERYDCAHAVKFRTIMEDTKELMDTIVEIIEYSPAAEDPDNAGFEEITYEDGKYTIKYRGRIFKMQLILVG